MTSLKNLSDARSVVEALGRKSLQDRVQTTSQNITNWIARGWFPPELMTVMTRMLKSAGHRAPPRLWRQTKTHGGNEAAG
jgi:hypothetical protein